MRALLPEPAAEVDLFEAYALSAEAVDGSPFVRCNMITSLDGAISVAGRSGLLGGPSDRQVFLALRAEADVVLVGAGTARTEGYGPVRLSPELRQRRRERGQPEVPPIAIVTGSGNLDWSSPFFTEAEARPIVFLSNRAGADVRDRAGDVADLVLAGEDRVDPAQVVGHLDGAGYRSVLLEGGPGLNADVVRAGLLDELCLTLSPRLVSGSGPRMMSGSELDPPLELRTVHVLEEDGFLFLRLAIHRSDNA